MNAALRLASDPELAAAIPGVRTSVRVASAALALDCDEEHIRQLLKAGDLEGHRIGKRGVRIYADSIADYQAANTYPRAGRKAAPRPASRAGAAHREAMAALRDMGIL